MNFRRVLDVARLHGLDLGRRRLVMVLLALLPAVIYKAMGDDEFAVVVGGILMTFSIAGPAIFVVLAGRSIDPRLTLAGYRPLEILLGRLVLLEAMGLTVAALFGGLVVGFSDVARPGYVFPGVLLLAAVAVPFGMLLGTALPGDLEAMLAMMGVVGVQMVSPAGGSISRVMPLHGPKQLLRLAGGWTPSASSAIAHAVVSAIVLFALAAAAKARQTAR